jgi:hypothetical protein
LFFITVNEIKPPVKTGNRLQYSARLDYFSRAGSAMKESNMKNALSTIARGFSPVFIFILAALLSVPNARADLSLNLDLYKSIDPNSGQTNWYTWASLNTTNTIVTYYQLYSTHSNILDGVNGGTTSTAYFSDLLGMLNEITNGNWKLILNVGDPSQQTYTFHVTANGISGATFPAFQITNPAFHGSVTSSNVNFAWTGPTNWDNIYVNLHDNSGAFYQASTLPGNATTWNGNAPLDSSYFDYTFGLDFATNGSPFFVFSTPLTSGNQPLAGWSATSTLHLDENWDFFFNWTLATSGHELIAHYPFDNSSYLGQDTSGDGNDLNGASWWGTPQQFSTDAVAGGGSVQFFGYSILTVNGASLGSWDAALGGSFTISAWVNTTNSVGNPTDDAINGAALLWAYNNNTNDTIPLSLTGGKEAFTTGDHLGNATTLHSTTSVNDGNYHLITVTRDHISGVKSVYVDGNLEATETGTIDPLNGNNSSLSLGGALFQSDYTGLADDVQIYAGVLSASEVSYLYRNPGQIVSNILGASTDFNTALGTSNLTWTTSGDANWFVENTNTYNGSPFAAQSGAISNSQTSTLTATVTGPGTLTFYWSSVDNDIHQNMDYEFAIDDPNTNDITDLYGANGWQSIEDTLGSGPIVIPPGQHTLIWTVYANNDADPFEAGFLDQVVFMPPDTNPVSANITLNICREQDPTFGEIYLAFPSFNSVTPAGTGTTTNVVQSPNNDFSGQIDQGGGGSGSLFMYSLGSVLNECTNGLWSLYINKGMPNQRQFQFSATINGLTTNLLSAVKIITPTNGATGFPSTAAIQWLGPSNYSTLNVSKQNIDGSDYVGTTLPVTATSWTPGLVPGTNRCDINYASNNYPNVSFTVPVDTADSQTVSNWVAQVNLNSTAASIFVVVAGASPVALINPQIPGTNFQFSFLSQSSFTHTVSYRTNLVLGAWQTYTNLLGDGSLKTISIPLSVFSPAKQGFVRVSTQ